MFAKSLGHWMGRDGWRLSLVHEITHPRLIYITRGQGRQILNGTRRGVSTNNCIYVPAGHLFSLEMNPQSTGRVVHFDASTSSRLPTMAHHLRLNDLRAIAEISGLLDGIAREADGQFPLSQEALSAQGTLLSVWVRRQTSLEENLPRSQTAAERLSARFCARLTDPATFPLNLGDHAAALNVTPTHLTRSCKTATGKSAATLLNERRLHAARNALSETDMAVQDIARFLGFGSAAYFARFIQTRTGATPSSLRETSRQAA